MKTSHLVTQAGDVIEAAVRQAKVHQQNGVQPVAVLDLDGTLFNNWPRKLAIVHEFARQIVGYSWIRDALLGVTLKDLRYEFSDTFRGAINGRPEAETEAEAIESLIAKLDVFWKKEFLSDFYQRFDTPFPGAVAFTRSILESGIAILYLTGRDEPNMRTGLLESFQAHGFPTPEDPQVRLIMKPHKDHKDLAFKRAELEKLTESGVRPVVFIDDNADNASLGVLHADVSVMFASSEVSDYAKLHPAAWVMHGFNTTAS